MSKRVLIASIILALILAVGGGIVGCGQTQKLTEESNSAVSRILVSPEAMTLAPNGFYQFQATLYDSSNNVITNEAVSWSVSGSIGIITQSGTFTATAVGNGRVVASAGSLQSAANVAVVDGTPPSDFSLITSSSEVIVSTETYTISWNASEAKNNGLKEYQILGRFVSQSDIFGVLKNHIDPSLTSATVDFMIDGSWEVKARAVDNRGLWRDSDGASAAGAVGDSSRILTVIRDTVPPGVFSANIYNSTIGSTYYDYPDDPIVWNSSSDENLERYEVIICTNPNNIFSTSVYSKTLPANVTSCEVNLPTGFYYFYAVAYDRAGHYRTTNGKTDIPKYDIDLSYLYGLPMFGINGSALSFVARWGSEGSGEAQFGWPNGIAVDKDNYIYVVDSGNCRIQKFDNNGNSIASWGSFGLGSEQFSSTPRYITVDESPYKYVYVTDMDNVYRFNNNGSFVNKWSMKATDEPSTSISGIAVDYNSKTIYVTDVENHNVKKFSFGGILLAKWGSEGTGDGQFKTPIEISLDSKGNIYVSDANLDCIQKFDGSGNFVTKWSTKLQHEQYSSPLGIGTDSNGNVWVADMDSSNIKKFDANGKFLLEWGHEGSQNSELNFYYPKDIATDNNGNIYFTEDQRHRVWKFREQ